MRAAIFLVLGALGCSVSAGGELALTESGAGAPSGGATQPAAGSGGALGVSGGGASVGGTEGGLGSLGGAAAAGTAAAGGAPGVPPIGNVKPGPDGVCYLAYSVCDHCQRHYEGCPGGIGSWRVGNPQGELSFQCASASDCIDAKGAANDTYATCCAGDGLPLPGAEGGAGGSP
jgi:hypothetical protein